MKKKSTLYILILVIWGICLAFLLLSLYFIFPTVNIENIGARIAAYVFLVLNTLVLGFLWFGSIKDLIFSCSFAINGKKMMKRYDVIKNTEVDKNYNPKFVLLYCTRNDFNAEALKECMNQDYKNVDTVILDDSDDKNYLSRIDRFAIENGVKVVRRKNKTGFKAGNLNNYLKGRTDYDYFVVLDSDEIIPHDYINKVLKYFSYDKNCGAVQARHKAQKGQNVFQRLLGLSVGSNGSSTQIVKNFYGSNALIGHGMTISRECYMKTGGFPLVVAEDISFAVDIRNNGFDIIYAPDIECYEEFPVNYLSLKKRQCKWTQGNLEYMRKYNHEIKDCKMLWFEKLDLMLSHYSLPIVPVLSFMLVVFTILLGFLGYPIIHYSIFIYCLMVLFLCSPLIPDLFVYKKDKHNIFLIIPYFLLNIVTYASLAPMMIRTVFLGLFGKKATFLVTPKEDEKFTLTQAILGTADSLIFASAVLILCVLCCGSGAPVVLIVTSSMLAPFVVLISNIGIGKKAENEKNRKILLKNLPVPNLG